MVIQRGTGAAFGFAAAVLRPLLRLTSRRDWRGAEKLPRGGCVLVCNHTSWADPITLTDFLLAQGRAPRFLAKESLFRVPVVGAVLRGSQQVPVSRGSSEAADALRAAERAVLAGEMVAVYPDGTLTRDPELWPMVGKTGAARLALTTGAPVVPVAQWGPEQLLTPRGKLRLRPRPTMRLLVGDPVDLDRWRDRPLTAEVLHGATEDLVAAVAALLTQLRPEADPGRWDPRTSTRQEPRT